MSTDATISPGSDRSWNEDRIATLRLALSAGVGPCRFAQLLDRWKAPSEALNGLADMRRKDIRVASAAEAEAAIAAADGVGAAIVLFGDPDYPARLAEISRPPIALHIKGELEGACAALRGRTVAIVGARNASAAARQFAEGLAADLSLAGVAVVSGLARGIDGAAHRGSLKGFPVGVVAGGVDVFYPPEHRDLQEEIGRVGALIAESRPGAKPTERHFPRRNRIVAGLADAVVVIEAAERSGSLITARFALEENREVMAAPGFPSDPRSAGANRLIRDGAVLIRGADDVLAALPAATADSSRAAPPVAQRRPIKKRQTSPIASASPTTAPSAVGPETEDALDPSERVRLALAAAPVTVDELSRQCQLSASAVAAILLEMELGGTLERLPGQRVALR